jgi:hypothetical protein
MSQTVVANEGSASVAKSAAGIDTDRLGQSLRQVYEDSIDTQPIPDSQIDLLLRLRHKERDRRRAG